MSAENEKTDPWRFHKSINQKIGYQTDLNEYSIYVMSRSLSYHENAITTINILNNLGWIDKELHYDFLFYGLPKAFRRMSKWSRPHSYDEKDVELITDYFKINVHCANEYLSILTKEQVEEIRKRTTTG